MDAGGITFVAGIAIGAGAMTPLVAYLWTGWRRRLREHLADLKMANGVCDDLASTIATMRQHIIDIEPLAQLGREYRARCDRWNAKRRGK